MCALDDHHRLQPVFAGLRQAEGDGGGVAGDRDVGDEAELDDRLVELRIKDVVESGEDFLDPELDHNKSIGNSHVLSPELRTEEGAWAVAHKLLHKAAMRLRMARLWTSHLSLTLRFAVPRQMAGSEHNSGIPQAVWSHGISLVECQDNQTLVEALRKLWAQRPQGEHARKPFFVGVQFGNLVPDHLHTLNLFSQLESEVRKSRLTVTMDSLNRKYGTETITSASSLLARAAAPTRIAFTSIPDLF